MVDARPLSTQERMGTLVETLGRKRWRGKELATLPQKADGPGQVSSLTGTSPTYGSYMWLTFNFWGTYAIMQCPKSLRCLFKLFERPNPIDFYRKVRDDLPWKYWHKEAWTLAFSYITHSILYHNILPANGLICKWRMSKFMITLENIVWIYLWRN